jgi:hypothetical protein
VEVPDSPHDTPAYWQALGQFVQEFSEVERDTNMLLWYLTDSDVTVAAAIYRERMPISQVMAAVEKLYPIRMTEARAVQVMKRNLKQLRRITDLRNDLLHNGTTFTDSGAEIVRVLSARRERNETAPSVAISVATLINLRSDCAWLGTYLWLQWQYFARPSAGASFRASNVDVDWLYT